MSRSELEEGFKALGRKLYADEFVRERGKRFVDGLRAARRERRLAA